MCCRQQSHARKNGWGEASKTFLPQCSVNRVDVWPDSSALALKKGQELVDGPPVVFLICAEISSVGQALDWPVFSCLYELIFYLLLPCLSAVLSFLPWC